MAWDINDAAGRDLNCSAVDKRHTLLDTLSSIGGKLHLASTASIGERVEGEIGAGIGLVVGQSVAGQTAVLTGPVTTDSIIIAGEINGEVTGSVRIEMLPSARVRGNLVTPVLVMHEGAILEGHCSMPLMSAGAGPEGQRKAEQQEPASASVPFFFTQGQQRTCAREAMMTMPSTK